MLHLTVKSLDVLCVCPTQTDQPQMTAPRTSKNVTEDHPGVFMRDHVTAEACDSPQGVTSGMSIWEMVL